MYTRLHKQIMAEDKLRCLRKASEMKELHWEWSHVASDSWSLRPHALVVLAYNTVTAFTTTAYTYRQLAQLLHTAHKNQ